MAESEGVSSINANMRGAEPNGGASLSMDELGREGKR